MLLTEYDPKKHIRLERKEEGIKEGREEERQAFRQEELKLSELGRCLVVDGRAEDLLKAIADQEYRDQLYVEYQLK